MTNAAPLIAILRRATHSGFDTMVMNNRMLLQCYNLDVDSDVALNYILYIPDTDEYSDEMYDKTMIFNPRKILSAYAIGHKYAEAKRKEVAAKSKDLTEEVVFKHKENRAEFKFLYYLYGELVTTETCDVQYPLDDLNPTMANCEKTYQKLLNFIRPGGACLVYDGLRMNLQESITEYPSIYYFKIKYNGKKLLLPFAKSMFLGIKSVDTFYFSVQESTIQDTYVYSYQISKKGIIEQFFGYVLSF